MKYTLYENSYDMTEVENKMMANYYKKQIFQIRCLSLKDLKIYFRYVEDGYSIYEIAKEFKTHATTIDFKIKKINRIINWCLIKKSFYHKIKHNNEGPENL